MGLEFGHLRAARVAKVHPDAHAVDIIYKDNGQRLLAKAPQALEDHPSPPACAEADAGPIRAT